MKTTKKELKEFIKVVYEVLKEAKGEGSKYIGTLKGSNTEFLIDDDDELKNLQKYNKFTYKKNPKYKGK